MVAIATPVRTLNSQWSLLHSPASLHSRYLLVAAQLPAIAVQGGLNPRFLLLLQLGLVLSAGLGGILEVVWISILKK
jgi:hypothetical protein